MSDCICDDCEVPRMRRFRGLRGRLNPGERFEVFQSHTAATEWNRKQLALANRRETTITIAATGTESAIPASVVPFPLDSGCLTQSN